MNIIGTLENAWPIFGSINLSPPNRNRGEMFPLVLSHVVVLGNYACSDMNIGSIALCQITYNVFRVQICSLTMVNTGKWGEVGIYANSKLYYDEGMTPIVWPSELLILQY